MTRTLFPFDRDGFTHELVEESWPVCLVRRHKHGRQLHWETVILQQHQARHWPDGRFTPPGWHYPSNEHWGQFGWTYTDLGAARHRFTRMARRCLSESSKRGVKPCGR